MPNGINPYVHTSSILNPKLGNKLYADEPHEFLTGVSNLFTNTPTLNKYVHSPESIIDIANLPALEMKPSLESGVLSQEKTVPDNQTINKRLLSSESLFDLHAIPCPFIEDHSKELASAPSEDEYRARRRLMSLESKHDLERIPDPFGLNTVENDLRHREDSCYVFKSPQQDVKSYYCMDYQSPQIQVKNFPAETSSKSDYVPPIWHHTPRPPFMLPNSAYDYTHYSQPHRIQPFQSDYDYTPYSQPMMPPPYYAPPYMPYYCANPYYYQYNPSFYHYAPHAVQRQHHQPHNSQDRQPSHAPYHHHPSLNLYHHQAPMYNLGVPCNLNNPMNVPFSVPSLEFSRVDTKEEGARIPDQFSANPTQLQLQYSTTPNNVNADSVPRMQSSYADSVGSGGFRFRDFSIDSMKELNALPNFSSQSLANEPSRNVVTAQMPTVLDFGEQEQPA